MSRLRIAVTLPHAVNGNPETGHWQLKALVWLMSRNCRARARNEW